MNTKISLKISNTEKETRRGGRRQGAGRPALNKKNVHLKLSHEAAEKLSLIAIKHNMSMSDTADKIILSAKIDD